MKTIVSSEHREVVIDRTGPFVMIGEKINPTGRKKLAASLQEGDFGYVRELARSQAEAGADILDVNVGVPGVDEVELLPAVCQEVMDAVDLPLCIDSANRDALAAALEVVPGRPLVNSVNGEEASLNNILPLIKERSTPVIGLTLDEDGIPPRPEDRLAVARKIVERATDLGIPAEDLVIDPLVLTAGADSTAGEVTLGSIELVSRELAVNVNVGASNVSFGLPDRHTLNQAFLGLTIAAGASCAITDPIKLARTIRALDLLRGHDEHGARYIKHYRDHPEEDD